MYCVWTAYVQYTSIRTYVQEVLFFLNIKYLSNFVRWNAFSFQLPEYVVLREQMYYTLWWPWLVLYSHVKHSAHVHNSTWHCTWLFFFFFFFFFFFYTIAWSG